MTRMNWDRARNWDRVRGDLSDMEMADERDERWFEREAERDAERAARRAQATSRNAPDAQRARGTTNKKPQQAGKKGGTRVERTRQVATKFGVAPADVQAARRAESEASRALAGLAPKDRLEKVARRLGVTPTELKLLRKALNGGDGGASSSRVGSLIRTVAGTSSRASASPATVASGDVRAASPRPKSSKQPLPKANTPIYVTTWGNVVHLFADCSSTRGFRHVNEPDPDIYRVPASDPSCRGRRVCGTCGNASSTQAAKILRLLVSLHGPTFDQRDWERRGWNRPKPKGSPINRRRR